MLTLEEKLKETKLIIKANDFEAFTLYKEYKDGFDLWEQIPGNVVTVGHLAVRDRDSEDLMSKTFPVNIRCLFERINGHMILCWSFCDRIGDTEMVKEYFSKQTPGVKHGDCWTFWEKVRALK